jgi:RNA polymerase sigma-70 factor (ECF subfamily)
VTDEQPSPDIPTAVVERFDGARPRLHAMARGLLGSGSDADDAVQETWLRLDRTDPATIENLDGWLTTVVTRVCLNGLRARSTRGETLLEPTVADPVVQLDAPGLSPESEAVLADSVGWALMVVLDDLPPGERLAFVLHDVFAVPFDEIARIMERSPVAVRQLASRGRRRVRGDRADDANAAATADPARRRTVVDAFFRAARLGELDSLVAVLDPDVVLRADAGLGRPGSVVVRGAEAVAGRALMFAGPSRVTHPVWVEGDPGVVVTLDDRVVAVMRFAVLGDRVVAIESLSDPERLPRLHLPIGSGTSADPVPGPS